MSAAGTVAANCEKLERICFPKRLYEVEEPFLWNKDICWRLILRASRAVSSFLSRVAKIALAGSLVENTVNETFGAVEVTRSTVKEKVTVP